ncbi:hypothetical protein HN018_19250 [Lichenicola cladoniae]|uniref:Uncharacterized protein n=1 Tax=Lichenicola cladoniae TaxID=1484109 RepID=A0A6M8HTP3_9PROT|nr:hypothetical protein [Lichenicola cladoniae]NPD68284.1 hypothetical protein [Acetobacteraceae bacterium]QKE91883.1 hypothetical protein HN018_19250 [Lichenicola cladoniae]
MSGSLWSPQQSTVALQAGQGVVPPGNPLAIASQVQDFQRNQLAIQSAKQTLASQNALGRIAQSAINADGSFNSQAFATGVKNDPDAAYGATEAIKQGQGLAGGQYGLNQDSLAQTTNRTNAVGAGMAGLLSNPNLAPSDIYQSVAGQAAAGKPVGAFVQSVLPSMPTLGNGEAPSAYSGRLKTWLAGVAGQAAGPEAAIRTLTPNVATVGLGGTTQTMDVNPYTNPGATNTSYQNTLSPEGQVAPQTGTAADGSSFSIPTALRAGQVGLGNLVPKQSPFGTGRILLPGGSVPAGGAGAPSGIGAASGPAPSGDSSAPSAIYPTGAPPDNSGSGLPAGAMPTGISPAATAAQTQAGSGSGSDLHTLYSSVAGSGGRLYQLGKALTSLQTAGATGPGSETTQAIASFFNTQTPFGLGKYLPGVNPSQIQSYDEASKYLTQYASNAAGAMGSDSKLATALSSNASTKISNLAAQDVVKATIGIERQQQAQAQSFAQTGLPPDKYDQWATTWNRTADPRAYIFDEMSPQQRSTVLNGMSPSSKSGFLDQVWHASQNGFIDPTKLGLATPASTTPAVPDSGPAVAATATPAAGPHAVPMN